jgi:copper transport protein
VQLDFNEPVEATLGAVRVYDSRRGRVDEGAISYPEGRRSSVAVGLRKRLGRGVYTATYRVVSADGHPVSGGFSFTVGEQPVSSRAAPNVADLLARSSAGPVVEGAYGVVRGLHYAALLLCVGGVFFRLCVWPAGAQRRWPGRLLLTAAAVGAGSALAGVVLQAALGAGVSIGQALDGTVLDAALATRTGEAWLMRACAWAFAVLLLMLYPVWSSRGEALALAIPLAIVTGSLPYAGHAVTHTPEAVLVPADVLHVLAAGAWLGGLLLLLAAFWPRRDTPVTGETAAATARFSRLALPAVVVLLAGGILQAWFYLGSVGGLFEGTYGWMLVAKVALLAGVIALAAGNRRRTARLADGPPATARTLRRAMLAEVALAVVALAATAALVRAEPAATANSGPVIRELDLGPMRLQLDLEPATVGSNDLHLYLFDRRTGAQVDRVEQLTVRLTEAEDGIGPITLDIPRKGPAHYERRGVALGVTGTWDLEVTARVSEFDEYAARTRFELRGR